MKQKLLLRKELIIVGSSVLVLCLFWAYFAAKKDVVVDVESPTEDLVDEKVAQVFTFGQWSPTSTRSVLGTVETESDVAVVAEVSGTLDQVLVEVGQSVSAGQVLARFQTAGDLTQISYQNAVNNLEVAQITTANNLRSADLAVANAERTLAQSQSQQSQSRSQSFTALRTTANNIESTYSDTLNFIDFWMGSSTNFRYQQVEGRSQVGAKNKVLKNDTNNKVRQLVFDFPTLASTYDTSSEDALIAYAQERVDFGARLVEAMNQFDQLIRQSLVDRIFTESERLALLAQQEAERSVLNSSIQGLEASIQAAKTAQQGSGTSILSATNALKSAQAQREITKAQNQSQIIAAQNQVESAQSGRSNLEVRAPFDGVIGDKFAREGLFVSPGTTLFQLIDPQAAMKVVAFLTPEEWGMVEQQPTIIIEVDGELLEVTKSNLSRQIDVASQKILVEFEIKSDNVLAGSLARISLHFGEIQSSDLVPFSAVSFEPDGTEVMIINDDQLAERRKVLVDEILGTSIRIEGGLKQGEKVIEFYKRALPGQKIISN